MNALLDDPNLGLRLPDGAVAGVVLFLRDPLGAPLDRGDALRAQGLAVQSLPVRSLPPGSDLDALLHATDDGLALAEIDAARVEAIGALGDVPIWLVGAGYGATVAMMALGAIPGIAGAIAFDPFLVWPQLDANHPAQPLDLLPGLQGPLQVHVGAPDGAAVRIAHHDALRERLGARATPWWVFTYPDPRGFVATNAEPSATLAWTRALRVLPRSA